MSSDSIIAKFSEFGKMLYIVGILYIIDVILSIIGYIGGLIGIVIFILMIIGLNNIKEVSIALNSPLLKNFYSRLLVSLIIFLIGGFFIDLRSGGALVAGILIDFMSFVLAYIAWDKFLLFAQKTNFGPSIKDTILKRTGNLKIGNLLCFLIITLPIGIIFLIVGYIGLGSALKTLTFQDSYSPNTQYQESVAQSPLPSPNPSMSYNDLNNITPAPFSDIAAKTGSNPRFCPMCGLPLKENAKFCTKCGAQVPKTNSYE